MRLHSSVRSELVTTSGVRRVIHIKFTYSSSRVESEIPLTAVITNRYQAPKSHPSPNRASTHVKLTP